MSGVVPFRRRLTLRADPAPLLAAVDDILALLRLEDDALSAAACDAREALLDRLSRLAHADASEIAGLGEARIAGGAELVVPLLPSDAMGALLAAARAWGEDFGIGHDGNSDVVSVAPAGAATPAGAPIVPIAFSVVKGGRP